MPSPAPLPPEPPGRTRPLSRRATRLFVLAAIVAAVAIAYFAARAITRSANDPALQQQLESLRQGRPADTLRADTTRVP